MRRSHWPLGLGDHTRSVVHTFVAGGIGIAALFMAMMMAMAEGMASSQSLRIAASCRTWALVLLAALSCQGAVLYLLRPGVLRLLTPTPMGRDRLHRILDPARRVFLLALPYALAGLAGLARRDEFGPWSAMAWMFYAAMLFRTLVPIFALVGVLLRKLLLPAGHWIVWGAAVASVAGLYTGSSWVGADGITLSGLRPAWLWLPLGIAFVPLGSLAAWACRRIAVASVSREELVEYAFPVETPAPPKTRSMLVEILKPGARLRRGVYLAQEAFDLHRAADWGKAAAVWAVAFGAMLYAASRIGGSRAHMFLTVVPTFAFLVWASVRSFRIKNATFISGVPDQALPVGYLEKTFAQLALLTCIYAATGVLAALGVHLVWSPEPGEVKTLFSSLPDIGPVRASAENLAQLWLLLAAFWTFKSTQAATRAARKKFDFSSRGLADTVIGLALSLGTGYAAFGFFGLAIAAGEAWTPILAAGSRSFFAFALRAWFVDEPFASYLFAEHWVEESIPLWQFEILAWSLPALALTYFVLVLLRIGRGRAHPSYKSLLPVAWPFGKSA